MNAEFAPPIPWLCGLRGRLPALTVAMMLALGLIGCSGEDAAPKTSANPGTSRTMAESSEPAPDRVEHLLLAARTALNERRLLAPAGDNAIESYLAVLDLESNHVAARQALLELLPSASEAVERAIAEGDLDEAQRRFDLFKRMGGSELRLGPLRSRLADARAEVEAAAAAATAATVEEIPAAIAPDPSAVPKPAIEMTIEAPETPAATAPPPAPPTVAKPPGPEAAAPRTPATMADSAAPAAPAEEAADMGAAITAETTASVVEPRQVVDVLPNYPQAARQRRLEGWVELEFAIGSDGKVGDVNVVRSEPAQIFDREAVRAAMRWRFEPRREDGVAVATRGRKVLNFKLTAG